MITAAPQTRVVRVDEHHYRVVTIKQGGMGKVWLLEQASIGHFDPVYRTRIAVKTFDTELEQIEGELNNWITLDHPGILPLKKIGRLNFRLAAIMPIMDCSLDDLLQAEGPLPERRVALIVALIAEALKHAWERFRILHLDLKPSNVLVSNRREAGIQVADWGISRLASERHVAHGLTRGRGQFDMKTSLAAGTPLYMAPERFSGEWVLSPTADIYSLALMAIQLRTGLLPFRFGEINPGVEILDGSVQKNAAQLLASSGGKFRSLCLDCLASNPASRVQAYDDVVRRAKAI